MTQFNSVKRNFLLSISLGALIMTSLTGTAEAKWSAPRCLAQCNKTILGNSDTKLNNCASNCDNTKMINLLYPNYYRLNPSNLEHFLDALKYQQSAKKKEQITLEDDMKKTKSKSKLKDLNKKQDKLISEINALGAQIEKISAHHNIIQGKGSTPSKESEEGLKKALDDVPAQAQEATEAQKAAQMKAEESEKAGHSIRRASKSPPPVPSRKSSSVTASEHTPIGSLPPAYSPPSLPPSDLPPQLPPLPHKTVDLEEKHSEQTMHGEETEHHTTASTHEPNGDEPMKIGNGPAPKKIPTPPIMSNKKPLTYKEKQALLNAQPGTTTPETPRIPECTKCPKRTNNLQQTRNWKYV